MTDTLTHALTIRHPFALAAAAGWKPVENKDKRPPLALIGQLVGIHAGLQWARESDLPSWPLTLHSMPRPDNPGLVYGALIGVARLVGVVFERKLEGAWPSYHRLNGASKAILDPLPADLQARIRPWWRGPWGWLLEEAVLLPEPIPMRGQQGLWRLPAFAAPTADPVLGPDAIEVAPWALEQWRKARETR